MSNNRAIPDILNFDEIQRLQAYKIFLKTEIHRTEMELSILMQESPFWVWCINTTPWDDAQ